MKKLFKLLKKDERGLTLVELLAVIVILAIVGAIAFVAIGNVIENSKKDAHIANAQQIISAVKLAEASGEIDPANDYPLNLKTKDISTIAENTLIDPWNKSEYVTIEVDKSGEVYSIKLAPGSDSCDLSGGVSETDLVTVCD